MKYYLAVDIGASSGRHMLAHLEEGIIIQEEVHRFSNGMEMKNGHLVWDTHRLFQEILTGMKKCRELGKIPYSMGIDTWAVDYVLLDRDGELCCETYGYRDSRTRGMDERVYQVISEADLYARNGIQKQPFNTIYQLMANKVLEAEKFANAETLLMLPDYFHYLLTGKKVTEYTNATTTQLVDPHTKNWDEELIEKLGYPRRIFTDIALPGTELGELRESVSEEIGFTCKVVLPPTHDTASAVLAVPAIDPEADVLYISSGTWSLMGTELQEANCSEESRRRNLTNEGGFDYRFRYLKNIMGMWMINSVRQEMAPDMSFSEICERAAEETIPSLVRANDDRFMAPESMTREVQAACRESGQPVPQSIGELAAVIYNSLAKCYADTVTELRELTGKSFKEVHIVGGGANASYLNGLTAKACGLPVLAGPAEATALGNIVCQMIASGEIAGLKEARECIYESSGIRKFTV